MAYDTATVATCDAPDCTKAEVVTGDLPPSWIEGTVALDNGTAGDWVACRDSHIRPAVLNVLQTSSDHNDTTNNAAPNHAEPTTADSPNQKDPA